MVNPAGGKSKRRNLGVEGEGEFWGEGGGEGEGEGRGEGKEEGRELWEDGIFGGGGGRGGKGKICLGDGGEER